jgi:ribonucleoside-diphosphate reductase alpha subunit
VNIDYQVRRVSQVSAVSQAITMRVIKRNGSYDDVSFDKVLTRIKVLSVSQGPSDLPLNVNCYELAQKVCSRIYDGVKTSELDELAAHLCSSLIIENPDYDKLASRISTSNHHKNTSPSYSETTQHLFDAGLISNELYEIVQKNKEKLNSVIDYSRDYTYDYFGFKTLERSYLLRIDDKVVERAQHMLMRVSLGIHGLDIKDALATYDLMSRKYFIHATPTLFNAGTKRPQCSSCFLVHMKDDSIDGIFNTLKDCAQISKYAGGIGMHIHNVRARNSVIKGTNGISTGVIPMLRVFNNMARYVNQAGKRNGSIAVFLEPWHADVEDFLELRKNHGHEEDRARDLFYAMWVPDLFMERVKANGKWSLMCPSVCPGLSDVWGQEFEELYKMYELEGKWIKQINAQDLWFKILELQIETGLPYIGFKDHVNRKTNQQNIGIIKSSNLCMEICQVSKPDEVAVCNLASVCLKTFVVDGMFDFAKLHDVTKVLVKNLNKIIDINFYPIVEAEKSNKAHRPIGIGVQGLADAFALLRMPFDSPDAAKLNVMIFETMYHSAVEASMELAKKHGPYSTFAGSPMSQGIFQFDMWNHELDNSRYDWSALKADVMEYGVMNSLLISPMPTASTSQIMSANECFEPFTSNLYKRKTMAGEFVMVNKYLVDDLIALKMWNVGMKDKIMLHDGSVQGIVEIPEEIRGLYKTVWEIKQKVLIDMAADRGPFICQSQSMNLFVEAPDFRRLSSMHFYSWQRGLKTGIYYLRSKSKAKVQQFTLDPKMTKLANVGSSCEGQLICEACQ